MNKIIFHIDVNSAFLSWEAVYRLKHKGGKQDLREMVSAVGGDIALRHGIILAKSIPAKRLGIKTGEAIWEAKRKCPALVLVPPNYDLYGQCSGAMMDLLREYSDMVEPYSIDEAFVDMSATCHLFGRPEQVAAQIKERVKEELGFTVNIGISSNKLLAKMASDFQKPNQVHTLYLEEIQKKLWPLPISDLFFVGRAMAEKLISMGIYSIGDLAAADPGWVKQRWKKHGEMLWNFAHGMDFSPVLAQPEANKGYGNSTTIPYDVTDSQTANKVLLALCETVANRLRADKVQVKVVSVGIRYGDLSYTSHQKTLHNPTCLTWELYLAACALFQELWDGQPIRHLGVHTGQVNGKEFWRQYSFFDEINYEKLALMDETIDEIRNRFGMDAVMRATFLNYRADHIDPMSGGISREKRRVDYDKVEMM